MSYTKLFHLCLQVHSVKTDLFRRDTKAFSVCDRQRNRNQCQYPTACYCDHRLYFGRRFSYLYYYNRRTNRCQRNGEFFNCNAFNSRQLCENTCLVEDAAR
ncbi:R.appendiculatus Kunitz/BPTI-like protein isoform X1 [Rhipicephalus microplus]|uniref:R.appendiculatus Kunitz/BPTI-like protein isoform X1 n=1 Tax=Rhipicephalus microplus TaxID=6941 RepID=UPI003F6AA456